MPDGRHLMSRHPLTAAEARAAITGILSRPGTIGAQVDEIMAVLGRAGKIEAEPEYCRNPDGPHAGTRLVAKCCPICGWSADPGLNRATPTTETNGES